MDNKLIPMSRVDKQISPLIDCVDVDTILPPSTVPNMAATYYLTVANFYDGIKKLCKVSANIREILKDVPFYIAGRERDALWCEKQVATSIFETLWSPSAIVGIHSNRRQRIVYMGGAELCYINAYGMLIGYRQQRAGDSKSPWIFWVGLPTEDFKEPNDRRFMITNLTAAGFKEESWDLH